ncbi:long-chain fatty acid--CoA ligase [Saccharopolyspora hirsuta]|uniref:Long-chain fatty acid--CoA ligase n=1 Tax=Saccharopolyspora hirsuta TaxID=1837 RepID=A0A5M7BSM6_SACHI|nr:AMP-binding protein [Saccharopolyspora hirsuta]KAA5830244.1 long-chain fatty acid--CoA ligase [Saccharopolyspora hirsuta]
MVSPYDARPWLELYGGEIPETIEPRFDTVLDLFAAARREHPDRVAVTYFDGRVTFRELDELSDGLAQHFVEQGVGRGDRVALYLQNVPQFAIALLAAWKAGAIAVPLNPMYRSRELTRILADARPTAVVSSEQGWHDVLGELAGSAGVRVAVTTSELDLQTRHDPRLFARTERRPAAGCADLLAVARANAGQRPPAVELSSSDIALLVYTSGTSGVPKGATNTHGNVVFNSEGMAVRIRESGGGGIFGLAPLFHITGLVCQLGGALAAGRQLDLVYRFEPGVVLDALVEHRPCYMVGPSTAYMALMNHPDVTADHFSSLELVYSGGAPLPAAVVETFRARFGHYIRNGYGLTETTATATSVPAHLEAPVDEASGTLSVGLPTYNTVVRIVDDEGADLPVGEVGEIVIEGPMVVPSYWEKPAETAAGIRDGRLHTGDVGFMDAQGWFYVVDRKKDMINASGFKVWPREVEDVLYGHPAVREVAVVGVPDAYRGETVKAYVSLSRGASAEPEELIAHCKQQLAAYKYPRSVEILDELPKTATGKILRRQLRDTARAAE